MSVETTTSICSVDEARRITDAIKNTVEQVWNLLLEAHEKRAWTALGYARWEDYVSTEFNLSRSHSYRLLDQAQVIREIEAVSPDGDIVIGEAAARDIKPALPNVVTEITNRVKANPDTPSGQIVREVVEETRARVVDLRPRASSRVAAVREHDRAGIAASREPIKPRRLPITDAYTRAAMDLTKAVERLGRLHEDDRFEKNREVLRRVNGWRVAEATTSLNNIQSELATAEADGRPSQRQSRRKHLQIIEAMLNVLAGLGVAARDLTSLDESITREVAARLLVEMNAELRALGRIQQLLSVAAQE